MVILNFCVNLRYLRSKKSKAFGGFVPFQFTGDNSSVSLAFARGRCGTNCRFARVIKWGLRAADDLRIDYTAAPRTALSET